MKPAELSDTLRAVEEIMREAGQKLAKFHGNIAHQQKQNDEFYDVVTDLDLETEKFLAERLYKLDPTIGFFGEEQGEVRKGKRTWIVDPIDGTAHFIRGLPFCTSMLALLDHGEVVLSAIYHFVTGEFYAATKGGGASCNNQSIAVSSRPLSEAYLSFETHTTKNDNLAIRQQLRQQSVLVTTINCGWEYSMVACGKLDGRITKDPWGGLYDFAPGSLLVKEAGGVVANLGTQKYDVQNLNFIAANPIIYKELTQGKTALFPLHKL